MWDAQAGKKVRTLVGHQDAVTALCKQPGADGMVLSCSHDSTVRQWNWLSATCVASFSGGLPRQFSALSFHEPTFSIATGHLQGQNVLGQLKQSAGGATATTGPTSEIGIEQDEEAEFVEVASVHTMVTSACTTSAVASSLLL